MTARNFASMNHIEAAIPPRPVQKSLAIPQPASFQTDTEIALLIGEAHIAFDFKIISRRSSGTITQRWAQDFSRFGRQFDPVWG
jgi:hypothetical protein